MPYMASLRGLEVNARRRMWDRAGKCVGEVMGVRRRGMVKGRKMAKLGVENTRSEVKRKSDLYLNFKNHFSLFYVPGASC